MKKNLLLAAKIFVSVSLLLYLVSIVDFSATVDRLLDVDISFLVIAFCISIGMVGVSALKWKLILKSDGLNQPYLLLLKSYFIGNFISLFLPSSIGGDIYRVYALSSENKRYAKVTSSVLFDRITGLFALLSISLFGFISLPGSDYDLALSILYAIGIAVFFWLTSQRSINWFGGIENGVVRHLTTLLRSFRSYRIRLRTLWKIVALAFLFQFLIVVNNSLYVQALAIDIPFRQLLVIIPLVFLTEVIPISINGAGVRDSAFVFFFVMIGHTKEEGLALGLLVIAMRYVGGLVGGSVVLGSVVRHHWSRIRD